MTILRVPRELMLKFADNREVQRFFADLTNDAAKYATKVVGGEEDNIVILTLDGDMKDAGLSISEVELRSLLYQIKDNSLIKRIEDLEKLLSATQQVNNSQLISKIENLEKTMAIVTNTSQTASVSQFGLAPWRSPPHGEDYAEFQEDGELLLFGNARFKNVIQVGAGGANAPGAQPATFILLGLDGAWSFSNVTINTISINFAISRGMDRTVAPQFLIGWSSPVTTGNIVWEIQYLWRGVDEDTDSTTPDGTVRCVCPVSTTPDGYQFEAFPMVAPSDTDRVCQVQIRRLATDGDDTASDVANFLGIVVESTENRIGSPI